MKKPIYFLILLSFFSFSDSFGQKGSYQLTFKGRDYYTHDTITMDSVFIENPARNCDTTIYGIFPKLLLTWVSGVDEFGSSNSFRVTQNYPNPFTGTTKFTLKLPDKKDIAITLTDVYGKQLTGLQKTLPAGTHTFTIETSAGGIYFLTINDDAVSKTLILNNRNNSGKNSFSIHYSGNEKIPEGNSKSTQSPGFTFLPDDELNITLYTFDHVEKSASIQPSDNTIYIFSMKPNYLNFHADSTWGYAPITTTFNVLTNIPNLTSWAWNFGDGESSNLENPTHSYTTPGTYYTVSLTAQGDDGTYFAVKHNYIHTLSELAEVDFAADITDGMAPLEVHFISHTNIQNPTMWIWDFGDGNTVQGEPNPVHTYQNVGIYTVSLSVADNNGVVTETKEDYIYVNYCPSTVTDADGNVYNTIAIGSQCWMQENLNVGTKISGWEAQANNGVLEKFCYGGVASNCNTYGGLYQWGEYMQYDYYTEGVQGICPNGWHIPTRSDFDKLTASAEAAGSSGGSLKEAMLIHWDEPNTGADNLTGFTALGAGFYQMHFINQPEYININWQTEFGTSSSRHVSWNDDLFIESLLLSSYYSDICWDVNYIFQAVSIRCIKDQEE